MRVHSAGRGLWVGEVVLKGGNYEENTEYLVLGIWPQLAIDFGSRGCLEAQRRCNGGMDMHMAYDCGSWFAHAQRQVGASNQGGAIVTTALTEYPGLEAKAQQLFEISYAELGPRLQKCVRRKVMQEAAEEMLEALMAYFRTHG